MSIPIALYQLFIFLIIFGFYFAFIRPLFNIISNDNSKIKINKYSFISAVFFTVISMTILNLSSVSEEVYKRIFIPEAPKAEINIEGKYIGDYTPDASVMVDTTNSLSSGKYVLTISKENGQLTCKMENLYFNEHFNIKASYSSISNEITFDKLGQAQVSINKYGTKTSIKSSKDNIHHKFLFEKYEKIPVTNSDPS